MKTTEEVFSDMLDAIAVCVEARTQGHGPNAYRNIIDAHALKTVREFFDPIIGDVAADRLA